MNDEPWSPRRATDEIRRISASPNFSLAYKIHAMQRESERGLSVSDVRHVLRHGFVYEDPKPATQSGYFRYQIQCKTPNSGGRVIRLVVIPNAGTLTIKLVTVMWVDETNTRAGTIL